MDRTGSVRPEATKLMIPQSPVGLPLLSNLFEGAVLLAVSLLGGGAAIHLSARRVPYRDGPCGLSFEHAPRGVGVSASRSDPARRVDPRLVGRIGVIRWRYPGGWSTATVTGAGAWATDAVIVAALGVIEARAVSALGVPGT